MNTKNKYSGFTLVELLVVIAIIALLLSILMPALAKVRDQGQRVVCAANLRTSITAWVAYSTDNKDCLVGGFAGVRDTTTDPQLSVYWHAWVEIPHDEQGNWTGGAPNASFTFTDASMEDEIRGIKTGLLYKYIGDVKPYHCASDPRSRSKEAWRSYTIAAGMNIDSPTYNNSYWVNNANKMNQIKSPSQKYIFVENRDARGWNMGFWDILASTRARAQWWNVVAGWHKKSSNWSFADGHVETQIWRDKRTVDICTELDYAAQIGMRPRCSVKNNDLLWIVDRRMNKW
jgi:prepilin-type N-terminal cleavage/methylation domain-containing protein/prepilin-type processing-associated H-X9-DG protein